MEYRRKKGDDERSFKMSDQESKGVLAIVRGVIAVVTVAILYAIGVPLVAGSAVVTAMELMVRLLNSS